MSRPTGCGIVVLAVLAGGCSEWPRYGHLPEDDPDALTPADDLGALFDMSWTEVDEPSRTDDPTNTSFYSELAHGTAVYIHGSLVGAGWSDDEPSATFSCAGATGDRSPLPSGDYIGDVDFYAGTALADGQLCVSVAFSESTFGWDLLLAEVDACGVPLAYVIDPDSAESEPLGFGLGGAAGGWAHPISSGDRVAVVLAAYYPNDLEADLSYDLGISLVNTNSDGSIGPCPNLPAGEESR